MWELNTQNFEGYKMKELLLKYREFTITTPYKANRRILFTEDFQDQEFDAFEVVNNGGKVQLIMNKGGETLVRFEYIRATDSLEPQSNAINAFREWKLSDKPRLSLYSEAPKVQVVDNPGFAAIVGDASLAFELPEGHDFYSALQFDPRISLSTLFDAGYQKVYFLNCSTHKSSLDFLKNLEKYLSGPVGSVQMASTCDISDVTPSELMIENGPFKGFVITSAVWNKVRNRVLKSKQNFSYAMESAFDFHNLHRLSPCLGRDLNTNPQDKRRKNYTVNKNARTSRI